MKTQARRAGFSLVEMLIVVVIIGILVGFAFPRMRRSLIRNEVINARNAMANMYTRARLSSAQSTRNVVLKRSGNVIHVAAWPRLTALSGSTRDTIGAVLDLNDRYGVTLSASPDSILIDPKGFGGAALTWVVSRSGFTDSIRVNNLGVILR